MNPIGFVKAHPVGTGVAVVAVIGLVILLGVADGGSQTVGSSGPSDAEVAAGTALQQYQMQAQAVAGQTAAARDVALAEQSTALKIAELASQTRVQEINAQQVLGLAGINASVQESSLKAGLEQAKVNAEKEAQQSLYASLTQQMQLNSQVTMAAINAQTQQAEIASRPRGLFSWLFG